MTSEEGDPKKPERRNGRMTENDPKILKHGTAENNPKS